MGTPGGLGGLNSTLVPKELGATCLGHVQRGTVADDSSEEEEEKSVLPLLLSQIFVRSGFSKNGAPGHLHT
jgi:hypothetical protein